MDCDNNVECLRKIVVNFIYFYLQQPRATLKPLKQSPYSRIDDGVSSVNKPKVYYFDVIILNGVFNISLNILMETKTIISSCFDKYKGLESPFPVFGF